MHGDLCVDIEVSHCGQDPSLLLLPTVSKTLNTEDIAVLLTPDLSVASDSVDLAP